MSDYRLLFETRFQERARYLAVEARSAVLGVLLDLGSDPWPSGHRKVRHSDGGHNFAVNVPGTNQVIEYDVNYQGIVSIIAVRTVD